MRVAIAITPESMVSFVAYAYEVLRFCARISAVGGAESQVFAVSSVPEKAFRQRFSFISSLDSRHTAPVDWVFVPALKIRDSWNADGYRRLLDWLRAASRQGALISSFGTGSFLLAAAGLLDGKAAVTYSGFADFFAAQYPQVRLRRDLEWIRGDGLVLSGDLPWPELMLAIAAEFWGEEVARVAASTYALHWERRIDMKRSALPADSVVLQGQRWLAENLCQPDPITCCAEHLGLSRRTLSRRFKEATGGTPRDFLQQARLRASVNFLMFSACSVEEIGYRVGYEDVGTFYRLFRRSLGISPNRYRRQFAQPKGPASARGAVPAGGSGLTRAAPDTSSAPQVGAPTSASTSRSKSPRARSSITG